MVAVSLRGVGKRFPGAPPLFRHLDLDLVDGELMVLVGPSGSGKTTVLRMIAGLDAPTSGAILFDGEPVNEVPARERNVAMVFQNGALFSHMSAGENIAFPLRIRHVDRDEADRRVASEAEQLGVTALLDARPHQLSAGHRHAVATARAIIRDSAVFLLDEPLATLDARARVRVRSEVVRLHRELGATMLYVTNDTSEAMAIGERIAVLDASGVLHQVDSPRGVYETPHDTFVASFMGALNLARSRLEGDSAGYGITLGADHIRLGREVIHARPALAPYRGKEVLIGVRPEHLTPAAPGTPFDQCIHGRVSAVADLGAHLAIEVKADSVTFTARLPRRRPLYRGDPIELAVEASRFLFFDPASEQLISPG